MKVQKTNKLIFSAKRDPSLQIHLIYGARPLLSPQSET